MAYEIPVFCERALAPSIVAIEQRSPLVFQGASPLTIFFHSIYYFGRDQVTYSKSFSALDPTLYAHREVTPFLKSKVCYWIWIALKGAVQASVVWNWKVWLGLNAVGLFFEYKKRALLKSKTPHFSLCGVLPPPPRAVASTTKPPQVYQNYLACLQEKLHLSTFFQGLTLVEKQDFCRSIARLSPAKVAELLELDFEHEIFDLPLHKLLLDALVLHNEDAFLSCYLLIRKHPDLRVQAAGVPAMRPKRERFRLMRETVLKSLSWTSHTEKDPQIIAESNFKLTLAHLPALQQIFPYLSNNDRARAAQCCKLFRQVVLDISFVPAIQRDIDSKLLWFLDKSVPVDDFSKGQIEKLLKTAYQQGAWQQHNVGDRLLLPRHDIELWKYACQLYLSLSPHIEPVPICHQAYLLYQDWEKGTLSPERKRDSVGWYLNFVYNCCVFAVVTDPLMQLILEKGSPDDKQLLCSEYLKDMTRDSSQLEATACFLNLLKRYLLHSPEAFQTFLTPFRPFLKAEADQFDQDKAEAAWQKSHSPVSLNPFTDSKISEILFFHAPLYNSIIAKLNIPDASLLRNCLAARLYRKDP